MSLFGGSQSQPQTGLFGGAPSGAQASGMFQPKPSAFGGGSANKPATGGGLFGGASTTSTAPSTSLFGGGGVSQAVPGGMFGSKQPTPQGGAGGMFANAQIPKATSTSAGLGGGLFGQSAGIPGQAQGLQLTQQSTANPAASGGGMFGGIGAVKQAPAAGGLFGGGVAQPAPAAGGLFGGGVASPAPAAGGLFGRGAATPAPAAGGMFGGGAAAPAQAAGGMFGGIGASAPAPAAGGLFGQGAPAIGGFGIPGPSQYKQPQQYMTNCFSQPAAQIQQPQNSLQNQYYRFKGVWTPDMIQKLGESQIRNKVTSHNLQLALNKTNPWKTRNLNQHQQYQGIAPQCKVIDDHLGEQQQQLAIITESINKMDQKMTQLDKDIDEAVKSLQGINDGQLSITFQIQALQMDVSKIVNFRHELGRSLQFYQCGTQEYHNKIEVPSLFFIEMHKHHEKIISMLDIKIQQAESLAQGLKDDTDKKLRNLGNRTQVLKQQKEIKYQIFDVCKLIYDQQSATGAQLNQIERKIRQLREKFTKTMVNKKDYITSYEEIDMMFDSQQQPSSRIHINVQKKITEIKQRNIYAKLEEKIKALALDSKGKKQQIKSAKEILKQKPQYNPLLKTRDELELGYFLSNPIDQVQGTRGSQGLKKTAGMEYLGKRSSENLTPKNDLVYFKNNSKLSQIRQNHQYSQINGPQTQQQDENFYGTLKRAKRCTTPVYNNGGMTRYYPELSKPKPFEQLYSSNQQDGQGSQFGSSTMYSDNNLKSTLRKNPIY